MKLLHTMVRVTDLDRSITFYQDCLGLKLLRRQDYPTGQFTLAFMGYGEHPDDGSIELTHNWGVDQYDMGNAYGHIAIEVNDINGACASIAAKGGNVTRPPGPMKHGTTVIAFVEDPDGYKIELIER